MTNTHTNKQTSPRQPKSTPEADKGMPAGILIDARIAELQDWRGELLAQVRQLIRSVDSAIVEEWKWNVPVWSCDGILCTGETYKKVVKLTFPKGAALPDPAGLFNSSLDGNVRRAIDVGPDDLVQGRFVQAAALQALVQAAVAVNRAAPVRVRKTNPDRPGR
ncbi:MAG: hypothetical protein RIQ60_886 [Pseudomonadota bacterium]|jgi:hypothetical protein